MRVVLSLVCLLLMGWLVSCRERPVSQGEVQTVIDSLEVKLAWADYRYEQERWRKDHEGGSDSLAFFGNLKNHLLGQRTAVRALQKGCPLLEKETDRRRCEILRGRLLPSLIENDPAVARLQDSIANLPGSQLAYDPDEFLIPVDLFKRSVRDNEPASETGEIWCRLHEGRLSMQAALLELVQLRNRQAKRLGYKDFYAFSMSAQGEDPQQLASLSARLEQDTDPAYRDILAQIKLQLHLDSLELWDVCRWLAERHLAIDTYLPADSQLPYVRRSLERAGIGLDSLPIYFDLGRAVQGYAEAQCYQVLPGRDHRISAALAEGFESTADLIAAVGACLPGCFLDSLPLSFRRLPAVWERATAAVLSGMTDDPQWLVVEARVPEELALQFNVARHCQEFLAMRINLALMAFEAGIYQDQPQDLNKYFWDMFQHYVLLPRHEELAPWTQLTDLITRPGHAQERVLARMVAAQTWAHLAAPSGSSAINGSVGPYLCQNYFRFGNRYDLRDAVQRSTGTSLSPAALVSFLVGSRSGAMSLEK